MANDLIQQANLSNTTFADGVRYTWSGTNCTVIGTSTAIRFHNLWYAPIVNTPFLADHTYSLTYSASIVRFRAYFYSGYSGNTPSGLISQINVIADTQFTIPTNCAWVTFRLWIASGTTVNETVHPELYDITYTDVDADCDMMMSVIGYPNSWFYPKWIQFASGAAWDGESCSEIACCISFMAGNISKIYVSNYAQGLADLFRANGRFGSTPSRGAFIWFDYDGDGVPDHTGRVYEILSDGTIHTVEGNVGGLVVERYYPANTSYIYGYGYPNYDNDPTQVPSGPTGKFVFKPYWRHKRRER